MGLRGKLGFFLGVEKLSWDRIQTTLILVVWDNQVVQKHTHFWKLKYLRIRIRFRMRVLYIIQIETLTLGTNLLRIMLRPLLRPLAQLAEVSHIVL